MNSLGISVRLIRCTPNPEELVSLAARYCRSTRSSSELQKDKNRKVITNIIQLGHYSVLEHAVFTFEVSGISRVCTHQLVRHRIATFSQQSQRSIRLSSSSFITPPSLTAQENPEANKQYQRAIETAFETYETLMKLGIKKEDARFILPQGSTTALIMTMNARSLRHFLFLRLAPDAQWEIRLLAEKILDILKTEAPLLFEDLISVDKD